MSAVTSIKPKSSFTYDGQHSDITFHVNSQDELSAFIKVSTLSLTLTSTESTPEFYKALLANATCMGMLGDRLPRRGSDIKRMIAATWQKRWLLDKDPFSGLTGRTRDGDFVCHAALMHSERPGEAELTCIVAKDFWGMGVGSNVCMMLVTDYAQATLRAGYLLEGKPLSRIFVFVSSNTVAEKIVKKIGMQYTEERLRFGYLYRIYSMNITPPVQTGCQCVIL